jgi:hypothetical protein
MTLPGAAGGSGHARELCGKFTVQPVHSLRIAGPAHLLLTGPSGMQITSVVISREP